MLWLWNFFLDKRQFSYVLIGALVLAGLYVVLKIPKENTPSIEIPNGIVSVALPGASPEDMETLVTDKLEDQIANISNIDTMTSNSGDGFATINVQFDASADLEQSIQDLRDAVARAAGELPADATTPTVRKINFNDQPVIVVSIAGDLPPIELSALGTTISDELKNVPGVSRVDITGVPDREVVVIVRKEALEQYGLRLVDIIGAIRASNAALPAGAISTGEVNYSVNFKGGIDDPAEIQTIAIGNRGGAPIYLRDIATIADGLGIPTTYSRVSLAGEPSNQALTFLVYKQSGASIQGVADGVKKEMQRLQSSTLAGVSVLVAPATDQGEQVSMQLGELSTTGLETVGLVLLALLVTIGWRESVVAALSIPLSFLIAFIGLYMTGNTLNFISFFALILAVGILVDSGIVVTEAIHARMRIYATPLAAARAALSDYAWPLIAGTMATVAVFAPLFFISGIVGKFIAGIPYTLIFVLIASIFVALGIVPLIAILFTKHSGEKNKLEQLQEEYTEKITQWYKRMLRGVLENRKRQRQFLWGLAAMFVLSLALPFTGLVQTTFFPQGDQDFLFINIETPPGSTLGRTDLAAREVEEILYSVADIASFQTTVGQSSAFAGAGTSGTNAANITVNLEKDHKRKSTEVLAELQQKLAPVTDARVEVLQANNGPESGAPVQIQFVGDNLDELSLAADAGKQLLATIPHVTNISASTQNNGTAFNLHVDRAKATALGLSAETIAQTLRAAIQGVTATSITRPGETIDVVVKLNLNSAYRDPSNTAHVTLDSIKNLTIVGTAGPVLLGSVVQDSLGQSNAAIVHKDKKRVETVSAYPDSNTTATAVVSEFQKRTAELNLPPGVVVSYGGETESVNQSFTEMFIALIAGLVLMFLILIVSFNSIRYTLYLLMIVPLSLIGVLDGLALTGQPISFTSLLGVIALGGVIINHAIILMDSMINYMAQHPEKSMTDIVVESSATRLRPIVLTTITTVIGMIPLAASNPTWGPLAFAVMFGLAFAITLTLILVPVLFFRAPRATK